MKIIPIYQIDAFTRKPFTGNPAAVVKYDGLSEVEMQLIATEMNLSETAFLEKSDKADFRLRWFTPIMEVDLCGHATIASLHYLKEKGELSENSEVRFDTRSGIIKCFVKNDCYLMQIPGYKQTDFFSCRKEILACLGITAAETEGNFILLENGYLYIYIKQLNTLAGLKPDMKVIKSLSTSGIKALVVYTLETLQKESSAHLRFFGPCYGIDEDPVTGSANGPLFQVLVSAGKLNITDEVQFEQGDYISRPGRVKVKMIDNNIFIAGNAVTVLKGEISV
jgi:trans-2,3-dihydro-3-hydroxyanthranilate isomerase